MRTPYPTDDYDDDDAPRGPSKSELKRIQIELQNLGKEMTRLGDEQLAKIPLPEDVLAEIVEYRRMRSFGAQRRQLQLIGKKMRDMDPAKVREAIARATGESKQAVALLHRCEKLRDDMLASDDTHRRAPGSGHPQAARTRSRRPPRPRGAEASEARARTLPTPARAS